MSDDQISPSKFLGLSGPWRSAANLGMAGVVAALAVYVVTITIPSMQRDFHKNLKEEREAARLEVREEREAARLEAERSRAHGTASAKEIGEAIRELSRELADAYFVGPRKPLPHERSQVSVP